MQTSSILSVEQRLAGYESEVEQWKRDHDLAIECMDFELLLQHGLSVFDAINWLDESWRSRIYSKQDTYDPKSEELLQDLYQRWLLKCGDLRRELERHERHFEVAYSDEFRAACVEVEGILSSDAAFFVGDRLVESRDQAIDAHRRGECEPR